MTWAQKEVPALPQRSQHWQGLEITWGHAQGTPTILHPGLGLLPLKQGTDRISAGWSVATHASLLGTDLAGSALTPRNQLHSLALREPGGSSYTISGQAKVSPPKTSDQHLIVAPGRHPLVLQHFWEAQRNSLKSFYFSSVTMRREERPHYHPFWGGRQHNLHFSDGNMEAWETLILAKNLLVDKWIQGLATLSSQW